MRILLDTRKFFNYSAYLLTNIPKTVKRLSTSGKLREMISKTQYPNPIELKRNFPLTLTRVELDKHFTLLNGFFNDEFSWQCDINATYTGPLFLQIIFVKNNEPIDTTVTIQGKIIKKIIKSKIFFLK